MREEGGRHPRARRRASPPEAARRAAPFILPPIPSPSHPHPSPQPPNQSPSCLAIGGSHALVLYGCPLTWSWAILALGYFSYAWVGIIGITMG